MMATLQHSDNNTVAQSANNQNVTNDTDIDSISRPSLYSHQPQPRAAPFEQYYGDQLTPVEILDELKSDRLEGVYNLSFMLLAFALAYLFVRNLVDNGFLAGPSAICFFILFRDLRLLTLFILPLPIFFLAPFILILLFSKSVISGRVVVVVHSLTLAFLFVTSTLILFQIALNPLLGVVAGIVVMIVALKMHSYVMTNMLLAEEIELLRKSRRVNQNNEEQETGGVGEAAMLSAQRTSKSLRQRRQEQRSELRSGRNTATSAINTEDSLDSQVENDRHDDVGESGGRESSTAGVKYPRNVTLKNLGYFVVAPTLVYETGYPRTKGIRGRYVAWHMLQMCVCVLVQYVLLMQFCVPVWRTSAPTDRLWWFSIKLALPVFFMWLLLFWSFFHCALNGIAEMTCFADRLFYMDWWNATDLSEFWRTWNVPVHEWCIRHLYLETVSRQRIMTRKTAALGTFLLSAVFHEYVCIVAFRMIRPYMFVSMILQVPLVQWSVRFSGTRTGNYIMWITLFVGQSWISLLYCRDYLHVYDTLMCRPLYWRQ